jgi:hypothetical protein
MKILIGTNLLSSVDANIYSNHTAFYYHLGKIAAERGWQFYQCPPVRMSIDRMRNEAAKTALQLECDYLVFIDDDMILQLDTIEKLIDSDKDIVMAHTYIRGYPFKPMSFIRPADEQPGDIKLENFENVLEVAEDGLAKCDAVGFACVAIKTHLLKELDAPWFITGPNGTEDIYFCLRCMMEREEKTEIYVRTDCPTGHLLGSECVHPETVDKLRAYYAPPKEVKTGRADRTEEYHKLLETL